MKSKLTHRCQPSVGSVLEATVSHPSNISMGTGWISLRALLKGAIAKAGYIREAYSHFYSHALANQLFALFQCLERQIKPGPLETSLHWKELGRHIKVGERAVTLYGLLPFECPRSETEPAHKLRIQTLEYSRESQWFVLAQTEGAPFQASGPTRWDEQAALTALGIERISFDRLNSNVQGFAMSGRRVAVSPIATLPEKTLFHELAHVVLGHIEEADSSKPEAIADELREVEAEAVALVCCEALGLPGVEYSRAYIQPWAKSEAISDSSVQRIFHGADTILGAGRWKYCVSRL